MNLSEFPTEILLNIFVDIDRDDDKEEPILTTLRLVCRRFNQIVCGQNNQRRLSSIKVKVEKITIAQFGSSFALRMLAKKYETIKKDSSEIEYNELIHCVPEIPVPNMRRGNEESVAWDWEALRNQQENLPSEASNEFFEILAQIIIHFNPARIEFARINLTRSFVSSVLESLRGQPLIEYLDFDVSYTNLTDSEIKNRCRENHFETTQYSNDIDVGIMEKLASNFACLLHLPNRFITSEFIGKWADGKDNKDLSIIVKDENKEIAPISLRNFSRMCTFLNIFFITFSTSLNEFLSAVENRMKLGPMTWQFYLTDKKSEIIKFVLRNDSNYQVIERSNKYNDGALKKFMLQKLHKVNGVNYKLIIYFNWHNEIGRYKATSWNYEYSNENEHD